MFYKLQHRHAPYLFVAPFVVTFLVFALYPLVQSLWLSMYLTAGPRVRVWQGLGNYAFMLEDPDFRTAVWNTVVYAFFSVFLMLPLSLGLAMLLNKKGIPGRGVLRVIFFSPHLVGMVFVALMFGLIFAANTGGMLNAFLYSTTTSLNNILGTPVAPSDTNWLNTKSLVMPTLVLTALWLHTGFNMIYFLAALQAVDANLYEAAEVDGAGAWSKFRHVTLPGIKHVTLFVIVLSTIGSFQLFEMPYLLLNNSPGPDNAGLTVVMYLYQTGFLSGDLGYASAIGWTLVAGVLAISLTQLALGGTWKRE